MDEPTRQPEPTSSSSTTSRARGVKRERDHEVEEEMEPIVQAPELLAINQEGPPWIDDRTGEELDNELVEANISVFTPR